VCVVWVSLFFLLLVGEWLVFCALCFSRLMFLSLVLQLIDSVVVPITALGFIYFSHPKPECKQTEFNKTNSVSCSVDCVFGSMSRTYCKIIVVRIAGKDFVHPNTLLEEEGRLFFRYKVYATISKKRPSVLFRISRRPVSMLNNYPIEILAR